MNAAGLAKLASDFGLDPGDVNLLATATHGRFGQMVPARKAQVADASLRVWRKLGDTTAHTFWLKLRDQVQPLWPPVPARAA